VWHATAGPSRPGTTSRGLRFPAVARTLSALVGALLTVVALVLSFAAPATADDDADLQLAVQQGNLQSQAGGQPTTLVFSVTNNGPGNANDFIANVTIPLGDKGVTVASSNPPCNQNGGPTVLACQVGELDAGQSTVFTLVIAAPPANSLAPTDSFSGTGGIQVTSNNDPNDSNNAGQFTLSITGAPPAVTSITGTVTNGSTSQPIVSASVVSRDVNGATCSATTDANGAFNCIPQSPGLAGGQVTVEATMAGFQLSRTTVTPTNGAVANVQLALNPAAASPSPTPSLAPSTPAANSTAQAGVLKSKGGFGWDALLLIVGILVALAGLGGGAWWIYRRKDKEPPPGGPHGDLAGAESLLPTMAMRIPNSVGSQTTVATPPPFGMEQPGHRPELPVGAGANASTAVWGARQGASSGAGANASMAVWGAASSGAGANASTAVWGADAAWSQPGGWAPAGSPQPDWSPEQAAQVNRSTEPIPVSGGATGWSAPANSDDGERTAEWPTIDPKPGQGAEAPAVNEPTAAWPAPQSAPPYTPQSAPPYTPQSGPPFPASAPPAQPFPASAPPFQGASAPPYPAPPVQQYSAPPAQQYSAPPVQQYSAPPAQPFPASGPPAQPYPVSAPPTAQYSNGQYPVSSPPAAHWSAAANPAGRPPDRYSPSGQPAQQPGHGDARSWGAAQPYPPQPGNRAYSAVPGEAPPPDYGYYEGSTPGAPLAGWDTPPAVVPSTPASYSPLPPSGYSGAPGPVPPAPPGPPPAAPWSGSPASAPPWNGAQPASAPPWNGGAQPPSTPPWQLAGQQTPPPGHPPPGHPSVPGQPYPTSGPPLGAPPVGAPPVSGPPTPGGYPPPSHPDYGNYRPAAPEPAEPDPRQWWSDQNPR
jgi:hypothetical protein